MYIHHVFPVALLQDTQCFIKILWVLFLLANTRAHVTESLDFFRFQCIWSFLDFLQKLSKLFTLWDCPSSANKNMCHAVNISKHCTNHAFNEWEELNICRQDNHQSFAQKLPLSCLDHSYTFLLEAFLCITLNNIWSDKSCTWNNSLMIWNLGSEMWYHLVPGIWDHSLWNFLLETCGGWMSRLER